MSTSEGKCVLVEVDALISWWKLIYSYRIAVLLVPYLWASMTFLPVMAILTGDFRLLQTNDICLKGIQNVFQRFVPSGSTNSVDIPRQNLHFPSNGQENKASRAFSKEASPRS